MSNNKLNDLFTLSESLNIKWDIDEVNEAEQDSVVDGVNILGRARGPFFAVDGESRNKRFYSKKLWENALNKTADKMKSGLMLGTIGHDQPLNDEALREGLISHRVTKLWIDDNKKVGMGEAIIFNTPAGQRLNSYIRGGVPIAVSSRADGEYNGTSPSGSQIVNENTFDLDTFDFVLKPGIPHAIPSLVESELSKIPSIDNVDTIIETKDDVMSQALLESLTQDKVQLQGQLNEAISSVENEKSKNVALQQANESFKRDAARLEESLAEANRKLQEATAAQTNQDSELRSYRELGEAVEIKTALTESLERLAEYEDFGTISELTEAFEQSKDLIDDYSELGSPDEIENVLETFESYSELGSVEDLSVKLELLAKYEDLGTPKEVETLLDVANKYADLGSPETIAEAFETMDTLVTKFDEDNKSKEAESISKQFGIKKEIAEGFITKHGKTETIAILESLKTDNVSERYRAAPSTAPREKVETLNENVSQDENRGSRLMKTLSR